MRGLLLSITLLSPFQSPAPACTLTIPELIKLRRPAPVELYRTAEILAMPFAEIVKDSDLIVEGHVRPLKTWLSDDGCYLSSEFEIVAPVVLSGELPPPSRPGPQAPLLVRQYGGTLMIDGVKVVVQDQQLPPFPAGQHVVLLLSRAVDGAYEITHGGFGAFVAQADGIRPVLGDKGIYDEMRNLTKAEFIDRVKRASKR